MKLYLKILLLFVICMNGQSLNQKELFKQLTGKSLDNDIYKQFLEKKAKKSTNQTSDKNSELNELKAEEVPDSLIITDVEEEPENNKDSLVTDIIDPYQSIPELFTFNFNKLNINELYNKPVPEDYLLNINDEIIIDLWGVTNDNYQLTINENGFIVIPDVGKFDVLGLKYSEMKEKIKSKLSTINGLNFSIRIGKTTPIRVNIFGDVGKPGLYHVSPYNNLFELLAIAGGINKNGSLRNIIIRSNSEEKVADLYDLIFYGKNINLYFKQDDQIFVPLRKNEVTVSGNVLKEGIYEITPDTDLKKMIQISGLTANSNTKEILIERINAEGNRYVFTVKLSENPKLQNGDMIRIFSNKLNARKCVYLAGNFKQNREFQYNEKTKLSDIFGTEAFIKDDTDLDYANIIRKLKFNSQNKIITFSPRKVIDKEFDLVLSPEDTIKTYSVYFTKPYDSLAVYGSVRFPGKFPVAENMTIKNLVNLAGGTLISADTTNITIKRFIRNEGPKIFTTNNLSTFELQESDEVYIADFYEKNPLNYVHLTGAVNIPGPYSFAKDMTINHLISLAGGLKPSANLDTLEVLKGINKKNSHNKLLVLSFKDALNYKLAANDVVRIRKIPLFGFEKKVIIRGMVNNPGTFYITTGETLGKVLKRAGGFRKEAFVKGAIFLRKSVRKLQLSHIKRLRKKLDNELKKILLVEKEKETLKNNDTNLNMLTNINDSLSFEMSLGRIVLDINPDIEENNFILEDGDEIIIPEKTNSVMVLGEVFSQTAVRYNRSEKNVQYYLEQVGGTSVMADMERISIIKANGKVYKDESYFFNSILDYNLEEGDIVFVPVDYSKLTKDLTYTKDLIGILYQLSVTAANTWYIIDKVNE